MEVLAVNSVAPTLLASALAPNVIAAKGKMIAITSQMGSIADNGSGGWLAYRASKAALNAAWKTLSVDWASAPVAIAMLHPGWVQTDMGGRAAPLSPAESVTALRHVIDGLSAKDKGLFLNHKGEKLAW
jgi:NAD(P)-dependent dehydrogenase (short-subunit alcohol dehydrogenase family)